MTSGNMGFCQEVREDVRKFEDDALIVVVATAMHLDLVIEVFLLQ